ncbi:PilZ domain-containing protein [Enterovibrio paralichthyis]|uniref:PilZ domain-containing protein n=1 Tax=Enterovibrio paralichthyis TaxID=2853805 RepID=UPI001C452312|nr:flagellar brake protein [Enterovibrio paralichthyis]MBV7299277.1 flagellar brake protein [Enterovibrio paralichthyis]
MNTNTAATKKPPARQRERVIMGLQAMDFIQHGTEASLTIVTPLGQRLDFKSNFIGFDDQQHIFFTMPRLTKHEYEEFLVEGFNADIEGISEQGAGALVRFRTRIEHVVYRPVHLLVFPVPQQAKLVLLRNEVRYELRLPGDIQLASRKLRVVLTDVSSGGCGFSFDAISPEFDVDLKIVLEVVNGTSGDTYALSGAVKNCRKKRGRQNYGMVFDEPGKANCRRLLSNLIYDGTKYVFKNPKKDQAPGTN